MTVARILVNGMATDLANVLDRGFAYGDGLFESIRLVHGQAPLWPGHMRRLAEGCARLRIAPPDPRRLLAETRRVGEGMAQAVVRITVTRGVGERGYAVPVSPRPSRAVAAFAPPASNQANYSRGLRMRVCDLRLAEQPLLAGIKHLNRLEQVLARAEWDDSAIAEGLLRDRHDRVISATMANLFAVVDGELLTPSLHRCGVAGVARAELLAICPQARETDLNLQQLCTASEIFLSSSVRGVLPVQSLDDQHFMPGALTRRLQQHWRNLGFSVEQDG